VTKTGIAELKNNLSRYLAFVRGGGEVVVLDRDTPVARIVPFSPQSGVVQGAAGADADLEAESLAEMERQGLIKRGDRFAIQEWRKAHRPVRLPRGSGSVVDTLLEMRREGTR
jgi:prevent-host-death family protein